MANEMKVPEKGAAVRMYCTGLGDCFLLAFRARDGQNAYVLIDCGVWKGTPGATPWMQKILQDIVDEVDGRGIELLVATHAHWDHLSGFSQAKEAFAKLHVKQVWLPWTEDLEDPVALRMAEERRLALNAAAAAAVRLRASLAAAGENRLEALQTTVENLEAVLKFSGYTPPDDEDAIEDDTELQALGFGAAPGSLLGAGPSTDSLLDMVRKKVFRPGYIRPSLKPKMLDDVPEVRIYALGPPTDPKYLGKDDPSTAPGKSEVYIVGEDGALFAAAYSPPERESDPEDELRRELAFPFDRWQRYSETEIAKDPKVHEFFRTRYLEESETRAPAWRRIDTDWLEAAGQLALNLDDHVNNTSLALAFELGEGGPVLLFPGDAQVGNWLSWHELKGDDGLTAESLLNRTVLYKVGHHASHNATLKDRGLKLMTDTGRLVAMIPVSQEEAHKPKGKNKDGWDMPYGKLLDDLVKRTGGRILRADREPDLGRFQDGDVKVERADLTFKKKGTAQEIKDKILFIEYTVRP